MTFPPALTWLHLFPTGTVCACAGAPDWFAQKLARHAGGAQPRVKVAWGTRWQDLADLPNWDGLVAVNSAGTSTRRLEAAGFGYARRFAVLPSLENARWFISMDTGAAAAASFSLYSPARKSAHLKKAFARLLARLRLPFCRDQIVVASRQAPPLEAMLAGVFPGQPLRLGLSAGAPEPAINRKASAAVMSLGGEILGFAKIAGSTISRNILQHEADMLESLSERSQLAGTTPSLLFANEVEGRYVTVQTPLPGSVPQAGLSTAHERFLTGLQLGPMKPASATAMVASLPSRIAALQSPLDLEETFAAVLPILDELTVPSTVVHGDFAPWNLRSHRGQISAFDWEYGALDGLPLIDQTHFTLQLGFQMQQWNPQQARQCLLELAAPAPLGMTAEQATAIHVIYLLDNIVRLLGEGYEPEHDMVLWYRQVLAKLISPRREAALA